MKDIWVKDGWQIKPEDETLKKWKCISIKQFYTPRNRGGDMKRQNLSLYKLSHVGWTERRNIKGSNLTVMASLK